MNDLTAEEQLAKDAAKEIKRLRNAGCFDDALAHGIQYTTRYGEHPRVLCSIGEVYKRRRNLPKARECFERTLAINPRDEVALTAIGQTYLEERNLPKARECFERTLTINPRNEVALTAIGQTWLEERNLPKARECFERTLAINPKNEVAHLMLGKTALREGNYPAALKALHGNMKQQFHRPSMRALQRLAAHDIGRVQYQMVLQMASATGQISPSEQADFQMSGDVTPITADVIARIEEEIGQYARSKIFQRDGRVPVPINRDAFHVMHNRPTVPEIQEIADRSASARSR